MSTVMAVSTASRAEPEITASALLCGRQLLPEQRVILRGIDSEGYEAILKAIGDQAAVRLAYDQGDVELMSPSIDHGAFKRRLGRLVETLTLELDIPCESLGSPTWRKALKQKGIEPDECFYIANSPKVAGRFNGQTLVVEVLQQDGTYVPQPISPSQPFLPLVRLVDWVHAAEGINQTTWIRRFRDWVLEEFGPRNI